MTCDVCANQTRVALWKKNQTDNTETEKKQELKEIPVHSESKVLVVPKVKKGNSIVHTVAKINKANDQVSKKDAAISQVTKNVIDSQKKDKPKKNKNKTLLLTNTSKNAAKKGAPSTSAMKKNSLLQLAAALKTKTKISDSNCRLKQMFNSK